MRGSGKAEVEGVGIEVGEAVPPSHCTALKVCVVGTAPLPGKEIGVSRLVQNTLSLRPAGQ